MQCVLPAGHVGQEHEYFDSKQLCKHDWVGDDNCAYCALEDAQAEIERLTSENHYNAIATTVVQNVCELPDYNSPDDQPELLQCTVTELHNAVMVAFEATAQPVESDEEYVRKVMATPISVP